MKKWNWWVIGSGVAVGIAALILTACGNPANMGFCIACFLRDTAGALGLHTAAKVQYIRPEIIGLVLGAFFMVIYTTCRTLYVTPEEKLIRESTVPQ